MYNDRMVRALVISSVLVACGGGQSTNVVPVKRPVVAKAPLKPAETELDREAKRREAARAIVPERSQCLPPILRKSTGPRLELAAFNGEPIACAIDTDNERLLGPIACWKIDLATGELRYREPAPLPGVGFSVLLDDRCARGFCIPASSDIPESKIARVAYDLEGARVAVLAADEIHVFDTKSRTRIGGFKVTGNGGVDGEAVAVHFVGDTVLAVGGVKKTSTPGGVWAFKTDGTRLGAIQTPEGKPASTVNGSLLLLDKGRIAIAEQGFLSVIVYEIEGGKRTRMTRTVPRSPCTPGETTAFWEDDDDVTLGEKCQAYVDKTFAPMIGATGIAGAKNWLVALRGTRVGTLAIIDSSLVEKRAIDLAWCETDAKSKGE